MKGPNHCWSLNGSTFTKFVDQCEDNSVEKSLSEWYEKSQDCLWTHWLPMTSILFLIETFYCNIFRCNYLENKKFFCIFFSPFWNLDSNSNIFKKKMTLIADVFLNLQTPKNVVRKMSKKTRFRRPFHN